MKKLRIILSALAFVFAVTAAFAFAQQIAWYKPAVGAVTQGAITEPSSTDLHPCLLQDGQQCKVGSRNAYDSQANAINQTEVGLLKFN